MKESSIHVPPISRLLVGICSAREHIEQRAAIRSTWLMKKPPNTRCLFFVGDGNAMVDEPDVVMLNVPDGYRNLPEKVLAFLQWSTDSLEFDWLFKCDDDTYLALERLPSIFVPDVDLVGNEFIESRGSPSGGAGYLLSRKIVDRISSDTSIPFEGDEDVLIGEAAIHHGAVANATRRLCWNNERFPSPENDVITSHWCSPGRLKTIHAGLTERAELIQVNHPFWNDRLSLFPSGYFRRESTACCGTWCRHEGDLVLNWFDWPNERLIRDGSFIEASGSDSSLQQYVVQSDPAAVFPPAVQRDLELRAPRHICVWLTTSSYGLPHIDRFLEYNPGVEIHVISHQLCQGEARRTAWRNADRLIRDWWHQQGDHLAFDYAVFLEWDVLFSSSLSDVFTSEDDFLCKEVMLPSQQWHWFEETPRLPLGLAEFATGIVPLGVSRISRECLNAVFSHPLAPEAYKRDIFSELRLPTLASACGFAPVACPETLRNVEWQEVSPEAGSGVWHSVKTRTDPR